MINKQLTELLQACQKLDSVTDTKFSYAVIKNQKMIKKEIDRLYDIVKPIKGFNEFENKRVKLAEEHSIKDEKGKPMTENKGGVESYSILNKAKFKKELNALRKEYKDAIKEKETQIKKLQKELDKEITLKFHMVEELPSTMTARQLEVVGFMYEESEK